jgi:HAD superfamily hydrolase (TIGR01549 family)
MIANRRPDCTLRQVFDDEFYPFIQTSRQDLETAILEFYQGEYGNLRHLTEPNEAGRAVVEKALERGYRVAIATNPLFPRTAILQRLKWAGLDPDTTPFAIIPSYETAHFAKPNPEYYAEILSWIGWPKGPVIMVGDDPINDIEPANKLGILSYWVTDQTERTALPENIYPSGHGKLENFFSWIDSLEDDQRKPDYDLPSGMLATMRATPAGLEHLVNLLSMDVWNKRPSKDEWSQTEILCHLRDVDEEVNLNRVRKVLSEENPFIAGQDTDPWAEKRTYICQDGPEALARFTVIRVKLLDLLEKVPESDWNRTARHAIFGPTTLKEIVRIIAEHDRLHLRQLSTLIAGYQV